MTDSDHSALNTVPRTELSEAFSLAPAGGSPGISRRRPLWVTTVPTRPLQFPSLDHFRQRVQQALVDAERIDGLRPDTVQWARRSWNSLMRFLQESGSDKRFLSGDVEVQLHVLREWVGWLRDRNVTRVAINTRWRGLSSLLRWIGAADGTVNPLALVAAPRFGKLQPRCLTKQTAEGVVECVRNYPWHSPLERTRNLAIIGLMLLAGLRRRELVRLTYGDVDVDAGTIRVVAGKGRHGGKTRTCYMPPQLRTILAAYGVERHRARRTHPEYLTDSRRDKAITSQPIRHVCDRVAAALGIRLSPHMLRHTYATLLRQAGVPDRVSMDLLGQASLSMLQRYSHVFEGEHLAQASRLVLDVRL